MNHSSVSVVARYRRALALALTLTLVASACSGDTTDVQPSTDAVDSGSGSVESSGGRQPPEDADISAETGSGSVAESFIANVTSADGSPVRWPEIEGEIGDSDGQVTGPSDPSGWYEVRAPGHATTYARPVVSIGGFDILDVELTPLAFPLVIGADAQLIAMDDGVSVTVPAGALPTDTWLTVTELPARHLSAPWAPVEGGYRTRIFSFEATREDGSEVQPTEALTLRLDDDSSLGGVTSLATFDPGSGRWVRSGDCVESGVGVECAVSHFSLSTPVGGGPYTVPSGPEGGSGGAEADSQAGAEEAQQTIDGEESGSEEFRGRLQSLLESAVVAARSAPSRATKDRLASMITVGNAYGIDTAAATGALGAAYEAVSSEVIDGAQQAKKPRCEYFAPLTGVVAEGEILSSLGVSPTRQAAAVELLTEIEIECRYLWTGTIEYRFPAPEQWEIFSAVAPGARYEDRGIDQWVETASVMITVDPESGQLEGRVTDVPSFVPLRFRLDMNTPGQPCQGEYWQDYTVEGVGSGQPRVGTGDVPDLMRRAASGAVSIPLEFDGFYEAPQFSVSPPRLAGDSSVRVQTQLDINTFIVPCENLSDSMVDDDFVIEPYTTQLIDGFGFLSPVEPRVTLNEMLNSAPRTEPDGRIVIEGRRELSVGMDLAVPFQEGTVTWRFTTDSVFEGYGDGG
jgi:hypothetical protein